MPLLPKPDNSGNYELMYEGNDPISVCLYEAMKENIICKCHQIFDHPTKFNRHLKEIHNVTDNPEQYKLKIHPIDDDHQYVLLDLGDYNDCYTKMVICGNQKQIDDFVKQEFYDRGYNDDEIEDMGDQLEVFQKFTDDQEQQVFDDDPRLDENNEKYDSELAENFESFESLVEFGISVYPIDNNKDLFDEIYHVCYAYSGFINLSDDENFETHISNEINHFDDLGSDMLDQPIETFNSVEPLGDQ